MVNFDHQFIAFLHRFLLSNTRILHRKQRNSACKAISSAFLDLRNLLGKMSDDKGEAKNHHGRNEL